MVALLWFFSFGIAAVAGRVSMHTAMGALDGPGRTELVSGYDSAVEDCTSNTQCKIEFDKTAANMDLAANGLLAGQQLADGLSKVLETGNFKAIVGKLSQIAPFLGAFGPILSIFSSFTTSPEVVLLNKIMTMINKGFQHMEDRFDQIEHKLHDLGNVVEKEHFWTRLHQSLVDLSIVQQGVINYYKVTTPAEREERRKDLDDAFYDSTFRAIYDIAGSFEGKHRQIKLCDAVSNFTQANRYEVLRVSTFLLNRMVTGAQHLVLISKLSNRKDSATTQNEMTALLTKIGNLIDACDTDISAIRWMEQSRLDLLRAMNSVIGSGKEKEMANAINNTLSTKYYWRDWLVVVYTGLVGDDVHVSEVCMNFHYMQYLHWKKRYNVIVSSVKKTKPEIHQSLGCIEVYTDSCSLYNAKQIFSSIGGQYCQFAISGVVNVFKNRDLVEVRAPLRRQNFAYKYNAHPLYHSTDCYRRNGLEYKLSELFYIYALG